jgi:hypothetical protein
VQSRHFAEPQICGEWRRRCRRSCRMMERLVYDEVVG